MIILYAKDDDNHSNNLNTYSLGKNETHIIHSHFLAIKKEFNYGENNHSCILQHDLVQLKK